VQSRGDVMVKLVAPGRRDPILDVIARIRGELHSRVPEARLEYVQVLQDVLADLSGTPSPIELKLLGEDRDALEAWAEQAGERLRYPDAIRWNTSALARSLIAYGPRWLPLDEVVALDRPIAPAVLRRDGLRPAILMTAATRSGDLGGAEAAVREAVRDLPLPH